MDILMIMVGTRGDVQPAIALGHGLQAAGHSVRIAAAANFETWIRSHGLGFESVAIDMQALMSSPQGIAWVESRNPLEEMRNLKRMFDTSGEFIAQLPALCASAELVISSFTVFPFVSSITRKLDQRHLAALLQPMLPSDDGRVLMQAFVPRGYSPINRLSSLLSTRVMWGVMKDSVNQVRAHIGLPPHTPQGFGQDWITTPTMIGASRHVVPQVADYPEHVQVTGYWFLDETSDWTPSDSLQRFLEAGDPPVYVGFGSMPTSDPAATTRLILDAVQQSGQRALVHKGWAGLNTRDVPETVSLVDAVPHDWLFPRMAGVIHHGGAGTTAAGLRAGVPTAVIPHFSDQPYWGRRVYELGVGTPPIPRRSLTAEKLADAIRTLVKETRLKANAQQLAARIRQEDGVGTAVKFVQQWIDRA